MYYVACCVINLVINKAPPNQTQPAALAAFARLATAEEGIDGQALTEANKRLVSSTRLGDQLRSCQAFSVERTRVLGQVVAGFTKM